MAQEFSCCICTENYDDTVRCPRVLRCGHSLCQTCLNRLLRCPGAKACPECRRAITPNRTADFPKNFALLQLLPAIPAQPVAAPCYNGCGGGLATEAAALVEGSAPKRKRRRGGRHHRGESNRSFHVSNVEPRDPERDRAIAWNSSAHRNFRSCGCQACGEWAHGLLCRCEQCNQQMRDRGILCIVCGVRYDDYGWPFGYCSRGCWGQHSQFIPVNSW
jgi:hypothetical protein